MTAIPIYGHAPRRLHEHPPSEYPPTTPPSVTVTVQFTVEESSDESIATVRAILHDLRQSVARSVNATLRIEPEVRQAVSQGGTAFQSGTARIAGTYGDDVIRIFPDSRKVLQGPRPLTLSRLEFDLLLFLAKHPGHVFSRQYLLESVWGCLHDRHRTVDVHIRRLRSKAGEVPLVTTIRGVGYRLADKARLLVMPRNSSST